MVEGSKANQLIPVGSRIWINQFLHEREYQLSFVSHTLEKNQTISDEDCFSDQLHQVIRPKVTYLVRQNNVYNLLKVFTIL
jgi:hypothetical protein